MSIRQQLLGTSNLVPPPVVEPKPRTCQTIWDKTIGARDWSTCTPQEIYDDISAFHTDIIMYGVPGEPTGGLL